jgi:hypothetical protein
MGPAVSVSSLGVAVNLEDLNHPIPDRLTLKDFFYWNTFQVRRRYTVQSFYDLL